MTVNIDITDLLKLTKERNYKLYPVILYAITKVVNNHIEFRMSLDENDNLGYYINVNPSYTIFHKDNNTFQIYGPNTIVVLKNFIIIMKRYSRVWKRERFYNQEM